MVTERRRRWFVALTVLTAGALAVAGVELLLQPTRARIERNEAAQVMKTLRALLPATGWNNEPYRDRILVTAPDALGSASALPVYRVREGETPVAAVLTVVAPQGYVGPITLLVSLDLEGRVLGVSVTAHSETPGLGDRIDARRSDWLTQFRGRSLDDPPAEGWAVRRDGGDFDQITGATVSSRAVVQAVRAAAEYYRAHRDEIFARPSQ
jgi:electron transport complex protein RnfG